MSEHTRASNSVSKELSAVEPDAGVLIRGAGLRSELPTDDLADITAAVRSEWLEVVRRRRQTERRQRIRGALALAASLLVAVVLAWWWTTGQGLFTPQLPATVEVLRGDVRVGGSTGLIRGEVVPEGAEIETVTATDGAPSRVALRLKSGHSIRLDSDTTMRFASSTSIELERGALYVDSGGKRASDRGVEVVTDLGTVREIGTQFEVRLGNGDRAVRVRVREGRVALESGGSSHSAERGDQLTVREDGSTTLGTVEPFGPEWEWVLAVAPPVEIEDRSLESFLEWVSRETGWRIQYADSDLARTSAPVLVEGPVEDLTPEQTAGVVLTASGLEYRIEDGVLHVTRPTVDADGAR